MNLSNLTKIQQRLFSLVVVLFSLNNSLQGQNLSGLNLDEAPIVVISEPLSGRILYTKNQDRIIPPASLTKLMTLHLAFKAIDEGKIKASTLVPITKDLDALSAPPGSSLMFLEAGNHVTVQELMQGLAVSSSHFLRDESVRSCTWNSP